MSNLAEKQLPEHQGTSTDVADPEAQSAALHGSADTVMLQQILHSRRWRMLDRVDRVLLRILPKGSLQRAFLGKLGRTTVRAARRLLSKRHNPEPEPVVEPTSESVSVTVPVFELTSETSRLNRTVFAPQLSGDTLQAIPLTPGQYVEYIIDGPVGKLSSISFCFGTFERENTCSVKLELRETNSGNLLREVSVAAQSLRDNEWHEFLIEPALSVPLGRIALRLLSSDADTHDCVAVWARALVYERLVDDHSPPVVQLNKLSTMLAAPHDGNLLGDERFYLRFQALYGTNILERELQEWFGAHFAERPLVLKSNSAVYARFRAESDRLSELRVMFGTYMRTNRCSIEFELCTKDGTALRSMRVDARSLVDNQFYCWQFEPIGDSAGKWFELKLASPDATRSDHVAIWGSFVPAAQGLARGLWTKGEAQWFSQIDRTYRALGVESCRPVPLPVQTQPEGGVLLLIVSPDRVLSSEEQVGRLITALESAGLEVRTTVGFERSALTELQRFRMILYLGHSAIAESDLHLLRELPVPSVLYVDQQMQRLLIQNGALSLSLPQDTLQHESWLVRDLVRRCDYILCDASTDNSHSSDVSSLEDLRGKPLHTIDLLRPTEIAGALQSMAEDYTGQRWPKVSIVSVLYCKAGEIEGFLRAIKRQSYLGEIELVFVDDLSPDDSSQRVVNFFEEWEAQLNRNAGTESKQIPSYKLIRNDRNLGNCESRNRALDQVTGDVVVIVDADCLLNRDFVQEHANAYRAGDVDIAIGPLNLETNHSADEDPLERLLDFEACPQSVHVEADLQDKFALPSFLNCITRNFSFRRDFYLDAFKDEPLFDTDFSYSADPQSGFGWEDVEMGARLYQHGAYIRFLPRAFSVHVTHPSTTEVDTKPLRSLKNFRKLLEKHPDLCVIARRWVLETYSKICEWIDSNSLGCNADREYVDRLLKPQTPLALPAKSERRLRVLTYRWHCPHQYELYKLDHDFALISDLGTGFTDQWDYAQRPLRPNARVVALDQVDLRDFDFALLHFDENVLATHNTNGVIGQDWSASFKWAMQNLDMPKVAICHGTPQFYGQYDANYAWGDLGVVIEEERRRLVDYLDDVPVVCNSHQAAREWGFRNSRVIWQGFDPVEFQLSSYNRGALALGRAMSERPHYRGDFLFQEVARLLGDDYPIERLQVREPDLLVGSGDNIFAAARFRSYVDAIRNYSVYVNTTLRSPMPRSRGEAMLCGLATVTARNHDVEMFITNGYDGFYAEQADELAEYVRYLIDNPEQARKIGMRGRLLSADLFNHDRFLGEWHRLINSLVG